MSGYRFHRPLSLHLPFPPPRESAAISRDSGALSPMSCWGIGSTGYSRGTFRLHPRGKCRDFPRFWCTFPRVLPGHRLHKPLSPHLPSPPPGKVPRFPAILVHFPLCYETSGEVQQGMLWEVPSIQAFLKRASAGPGVKWRFCGKMRAVQQIARLYTPNNQCNTFNQCVGHCKSTKVLKSSFCETTLSSVASRATGSTAISRRTCCP